MAALAMLQNLPQQLASQETKLRDIQEADKNTFLHCWVGSLDFNFLGFPPYLFFNQQQFNFLLGDLQLPSFGRTRDGSGARVRTTPPPTPIC